MQAKTSPRPGRTVGRSTPTETILVTGFEPFGGESVNPSSMVAKRLHGWPAGGGARIVSVELPCVFGAAISRLREAIDRYEPTVVIALGQASGRTDISVERVALNVDDARIADNAGAQPIDEAVIPGAPTAYLSSLPIKRIVADLRHDGIPASVSQSAGTFVCNHVFFGLAHAIATRSPTSPPMRGGFVHLPCLPEQAATIGDATASMTIETMEIALRRIVKTVLQTTSDIRQTGGSIA
ncbi:MAG: pyroglutamyl-peptidase I [Lautropia sp.]